MAKREKGDNTLLDCDKQISINEELRILRRDCLRSQRVFVTTDLGLVYAYATDRRHTCVDSGTEVATNRSRLEYKKVSDLSTDSWDIDRGFKSCFWFVERLGGFWAQNCHLKFD